VTGRPDPLARNAPLRTAAVAAVMAAALVLACFPISNLDIGGHIAVGREILKTHAIPDRDFLSHTVEGHPYPVHQWLGAVVLFTVEYLTGTTGLVLARMVWVLLAAALLYRAARRENAPVAVAAGIVLLLLVAARPRFFVRPMLASLVFLPLLQSFVSDVRQGRTRRLWPILPLLAVWGHIHSGVLFGILFLGGTIVGEGIKILWKRPVAPGQKRWPGSALDGWDYRRLLMFSAIAAVLPFATMALVNPSGVKPLLLPVLFFRDAAAHPISNEYRPVELLTDWPFTAVALALLIGIVLRPRRVDLTDLLITLGFGFLAFRAVRGILPFAAVSAPLLARTWGPLAEDAFARLARGKRPDGRATVASAAEALAILGVIGAAIVFSVKATHGWMFPFGFGKDPKHYPERALDFVEAESVRGMVFNTDIFASSLLWRWRGHRYPVFVDMRLEAYPEDFWANEYGRVVGALPGWKDVLARYDVEWALVRREGGKLDDRIGEALWDDPGWGLVYWDDVAMIYIRRDSEHRRNEEILDGWEFTAFNPRHAQRVRALRGDDLVRAANQLSGIVEWAPDSFLPRWTLAAAWTRLGQAEEAAALYDELARRREARGNPAFTASRAEAELVAGRTERWAELLRRSGVDPASPDALFGAAALLAQAGRRERAEELYRQVVAASPGHADALNNLALLLAQEESGLAEAATLIDRAVRAAPGDGYVLASRGEIRWRSGDLDSARSDFRHALELIPEGDRAARAEIGRWLTRAD